MKKAAVQIPKGNVSAEQMSTIHSIRGVYDFKGTVRFPACGRMLNFDSPWDGMYLTDRMVKWITIGGPVV